MIRIQNIYYMLAYAFQVLKTQGYERCASEEFEHTADLLSAILVRGISGRLKCGFEREYLSKKEPLSCLRGKVCLSESIKQQTLIEQRLICDYDEYSINSYFNQVLKTTMEVLLSSEIPKTRKKEIRRLLLYFKETDQLNWREINWRRIYNQHNQNCRMLVYLCYLIIKGLLQTSQSGHVIMKKFLDEQRMSHLYEKFILEYYRKEFGGYILANASRIPWYLDDGMDRMLPVMQSDIMLTQKEKVLIIDAKYYSSATQKRYNKHTIHSNNLYQIFTYVKNKEKQFSQEPHQVSGMLLYAKTEDEILPDYTYRMSGNVICVRTLDLSREFSFISAQLNQIAEEFFGKEILT